MINVEIVTIGNEVLLGLTQDTNSAYLCRVVRAAGGRVRHVAIVRDEIESIAEEIRASIARQADLIFTCGGLGPTDDDLTLAAVAEAFDRSIEMNDEALEFVERRYDEFARAGYVSNAQMSESRLKMARLPQGALPIDNPVGAAPAVVLKTGSARVVSLPGVPAELKAITQGPLQPLLNEIFGRGSYREREVVVECGDESVLAPALRRVAEAHKEVYIKSHASRFGRDAVFRISISASGSSPEEADAEIESAYLDLIRTFKSAGIEQASEIR